MEKLGMLDTALEVDELTTLDIQELKVAGGDSLDKFLVPDGQASLISILLIIFL